MECLSLLYKWLNLPAKKFLFPGEVVLVFFPWLDLDRGSTATYLIWKPPAVTEASLRNFRVMTFPGEEEDAKEPRCYSPSIWLTIQRLILIGEYKNSWTRLPEFRTRFSSCRVCSFTANWNQDCHIFSCGSPICPRGNFVYSVFKGILCRRNIHRITGEWQAVQTIKIWMDYLLNDGNKPCIC